MKQRLTMMAVVGFALLLAACGSATLPPETEAIDTPTAAVVVSPTVPSPATPTPAPQATEATSEPVAAFPTPNPNPECVAAPIPEDGNISPITADEWSRGADDAAMILVEYGDFQ